MDKYKILKNININLNLFFIDDNSEDSIILANNIKDFFTSFETYEYKKDSLKYLNTNHHNLIICNISNNDEINIKLINKLKKLSSKITVLLALPAHSDLSLYDSLKVNYEIYSFDKSNLNAAINVISNAIKFLHKLSTISSLKNKVLEFERILELYDENIIASMTDVEGIIRFATKAFSKVSGYTQIELLGQKHSLIKHKDQNTEVYKNLWETIKEGNTWQGEIKNRKKDGGFYWVYASISPEYDNFNNIVGYSAIKQDITEKKHIQKLAITDELTSLYNRRHFDILIKTELKNACRHKYELSFLLLDIDFFKQYNDTYGHQAGDYALKKVADCIISTFKRPDDYCFRVGGEEFAIIFNVSNKEDSLILANRLRNNILKLKIKHKTSKILKFLTISAGLHILPSNTKKDIKTIYKQTDEALYNAKNKGRNKISLV